MSIQSLFNALLKTTKLEEPCIVDGGLELLHAKLMGLPEQLIVKGRLDLTGAHIDSYPTDGFLIVHGAANFYRAHMNLLPTKTQIFGNLNLSESSIMHLPSNLWVDGHLSIDDTNISVLPKGLYVMGNVYARGCDIRSISDDVEIKGDLIGFDKDITQEFYAKKIADGQERILER